jgi:hypothetical protein
MVTNKLNLPQVIIDCLVDDDHEYQPNRYSVTELINPPRLIMLKRRHEVEEDASDMVNQLFGDAFHAYLKSHDKSEYAEYKMEELVGDCTLVGIIDKYADYTVIDYKTTTTYKIIVQDLSDWRLQGLMYAWLLRRKGLYTAKIQFIAFLKDWQSSKAKYDDTYPQSQVYVYELDITATDMIEIDTFIYDRIATLVACENVPDDELPLCTPEERWSTKTKYAVMKKGRKTAVKVCDSIEDAQAYGDGYEIETRVGRDRRCDEYCERRMYCNYKKGAI